MSKYYQPDQETVDLVEATINKYHPDLLDASIGILMRDEAPKSGGHVTYGQAKKVSEEMQAAGLDYDFLIWFAGDIWFGLTPAQQEALADHELMHCAFVEKDGVLKAKIRPHDFEEFNCIIERHGLWWPGAEVTQEAIRAHTMPLFGPRGKVQAVEIEVNGEVAKVLGE